MIVCNLYELNIVYGQCVYKKSKSKKKIIVLWLKDDCKTEVRAELVQEAKNTQRHCTDI